MWASTKDKKDAHANRTPTAFLGPGTPSFCFVKSTTSSCLTSRSRQKPTPKSPASWAADGEPCPQKKETTGTIWPRRKRKTTPKSIPTTVIRLAATGKTETAPFVAPRSPRRNLFITLQPSKLAPVLRMSHMQNYQKQQQQHQQQQQSQQAHSNSAQQLSQYSYNHSSPSQQQQPQMQQQGSQHPLQQSPSHSQSSTQAMYPYPQMGQFGYSEQQAYGQASQQPYYQSDRMAYAVGGEVPVQYVAFDQAQHQAQQSQQHQQRYGSLPHNNLSSSSSYATYDGYSMPQQ
ncbi:hypothetical protein EJF18_60407 [Clavispora lusitaniae]|uniref:Uncharacterized protein n=2 Tax=Clavispora lusitaniae TaxID=36911 RepID=C4Y9X1_CLAL4|nr:uncharacterized protein CLUG_05192 [Clavispora lusitaniae ATCC 42720]KAF7580752.1 hypothetical protein FOB63_004054 [Clavispora lusitaniae]EEQ41064.1 hypothetical protein CLUG_05192 [Clavispora lusitaniae ATCC 42720]QFZ29893.1 hypothetical protein EJF14_60407 [Clavispora lusitaniae]QFZ35543.1 hypothetical protein EJF16_60407 [Clavispora lusitaniae]QFZ41237.1 hypothetical protein EJF15_60407 [Clavispora lusitaniae]